MSRLFGPAFSLCVLLMFQCGSLVAQSCTSTFFKRYQSSSGFSHTKFIRSSEKNGSVSVITDKDECSMLQLDSMGTLIRGKQVSFDGGTSGVYDMLKTRDQNFVFSNLVFTGVIDSSKIVLFKINSNLDTLWTKQYKLPFKYSTIFKLVEGEDGSIYLYFQFSYTSYGSYPDYWAIAKLDSGGSLLWCKTYRPPSSQVIYRGKLTEWGNHLYFSCENSLDNYSSFVFKVDKTTGNLVWAKAFRVAAKETNLGSGLTVLGNTLVLAGDDRINGGQTRALLLQIDSGGNVVQTKSFLWSAGYVTISVIKAFKNRLYVTGTLSNNTTQQNLYAVYDENLRLLSASATSFPGFTYDFDLSEGQQLLETGYIVYNQSDVDFFVRKRLPGGQVGTCPQQDAQLDELQESTGVKNVTVISGAITLPPSMLRFSIMPRTLVLKDSSCMATSGCTAVKIKGIQDVCSAGRPYTYKAERNAGCTGAVSWLYDAALVDMVSQTDSTIEVRFSHDGPVSLKARMSTSCSIPVEDSFSIRVNLAKASLSLGADRPLCKDSVLVLSAGAAYSSYTWQDGTSGPSFTVRAPGDYHLTVTDVCGNVLRDTIRIGNDIPVNPGLAPDTSKCAADTIRLTAAAGYSSYSWSPGLYLSGGSGPSVLVYPATDMKYYLSIRKLNGCVQTDSVQVRTRPVPPLNLGSDTSFCAADSLRLSAGNGFQTYQWNTGSSAPGITVSTAGRYVVKATALNGCSATDTLNVWQVYPSPQPMLGKDIDLCMNDKKVLDPGNFTSYSWQNGSVNRTFTLQTTGTYWVKVTDQHQCTGSDTMIVVKLLPLPAHFLNKTDSICGYGEVEVRPLDNYRSFAWSTGAVSKNLVVNKPGTYILTVTDQQGCTGSDTIRVVQKSCMAGVFIPTAFTPDRNGRNDVLKAIVWGPVTGFRLSIFNRFGQMIFSTNDPAKGWDGTVKGYPADPGTFVYFCTYQLQDAKPVLTKGTVILIR